VPADDQNDSSGAAKILLRSLVAYVSEADAGLPRDQFLRLVINRIVDDLSAPLPHDDGEVTGSI